MNAIDRILQSYRSAAITEREKGTYFERLPLAFFLNDPVQAEEYDAIWPWGDWAKANGWDGKDVGIDLVAKLRNEDGFAAIQAKFNAPDTRIQKSHIDSFISASGKEPFRRRVVLDTSEQEWGTNAEEMFRGQAIPVFRIGLTDLRESRIDWSIFEARGEFVLADKKSLRQRQRDALKDIREGHAVADRGKMIMACGTGKTLTALKIAEDLAGKGKRVLFMVPSLALMFQTVREWTNQTVEPYPVTYKQGDPRTWVIKDPGTFYRVTKWAFGKVGKEKDKSTVIYNANITMTDVPLAAYDYVVNGKPALERVTERQVVKTDKASGIVNDANRYAIETMNNPAYPLELFQRVITVSLRTMEIVRGLPKLEVM